MIEGELNTQTLLDVWEFLDQNARQDVVVSVDSRGGIAGVGWELYRSFKSHGRVMVKVFRADSAAALAILGARWRVAEPCNASIHHHNPFSEASKMGRVDYPIKRMRQLYAAAIARETGNDIRTVCKWMRKGRTFRGQAAINAGLIHCIDTAEGDTVTMLKIRCVNQQASKAGGVGYASFGDRASSILRSLTRNFGRPNH